VKEFWCSNDNTSSSIENELKTFRLGDRRLRKRVAIVKSRMNMRGSNSNSSVVIDNKYAL
jgi:hypothetical protein